jgi:hypothetical protein
MLQISHLRRMEILLDSRAVCLAQKPLASKPASKIASCLRHIQVALEMTSDDEETRPLLASTDKDRIPWTQVFALCLARTADVL